MPGIRVDRFLASTAVLALLAAGAGGAKAGPTDVAITDQAQVGAPPAADADNAAPYIGDITKPAAKPDQSANQPQIPASAASAQSPAPAAAASEAVGAPQPADAASAAAPAPQNASAAPAAESEPKNTASIQPDAAAVPAATEAPPAAPAAAATPPQSAPPAASALSEADAPIADQLRELANGKYDRAIGNKKDRIALDAFYGGRNYAPIWITDGKANPRAQAAIAYLAGVDADGLDAADYPAPNFAAAADPAAVADAEIKLTMSVLTYAHHASVGRVHWSRVSGDILYNETAPELAEILAAMVASNDVGAALDAYEPRTPGYLALKAKLAEIRAGKMEKGKAPVANGPLLKVGMQDDRVPDLRDRLGVPRSDGSTYDKDLAAAVKKFQAAHDLPASGLLTAATVEALNGRQPDRQVDIIIANMERWRWMPHQFPSTYVIVNLPDFTLRVMHDDKLVWTTRIVIGKPEMPTPIMTAEMKYITVNPTWNVPPSIVNREYLPALAQDPTVLARMGLRVDYNRDGSVHISQPPGDKNALGRIRFNFPNKFLVYQHDTPDKYMFAYDKRAFSHGCMRVQDPQRYAEVLLSLVRPGDGYTLDRIKQMIAEGNETDIQFPAFIPVNLTYQTAFVDDDGKLQFRDDVYGRDRALLALLKSDERRSMDVAVDHQVDAVRREVLAVPDQPSFFGGSSSYGGGRGYYPGSSRSAYYGGEGFFSRLFGGFGSAPPVPRRPVPQHRKETRSGNTVER